MACTSARGRSLSVDFPIISDGEYIERCIKLVETDGPPLVQFDPADFPDSDPSNCLEAIEPPPLAFKLLTDGLCRVLAEGRTGSGSQQTFSADNFEELWNGITREIAEANAPVGFGYVLSTYKWHRRKTVMSCVGTLGEELSANAPVIRYCSLFIRQLLDYQKKVDEDGIAIAFSRPKEVAAYRLNDEERKHHPYTIMLREPLEHADPSNQRKYLVVPRDPKIRRRTIEVDGDEVAAISAADELYIAELLQQRAGLQLSEADVRVIKSVLHAAIKKVAGKHPKPRGNLQF